MEAQLHRPQDTGLHSGEGQGPVQDESEHHHKQSIKDHLKHGLGHEHDHEYEHEHEHHSLQGGEEEEEEEGTDDEEMEEGAEVHGGPYAIRSKDIRKEDVAPMVNLENPTSPKEDLHRTVLERQDKFAKPPCLEGTHFAEDSHKPPFAEIHGTKGTDHVTALGKHEHQGLQGHENIGAPIGLDDSHAARRPVTAAEAHESKGFENIGAPTGLANEQASHVREQMHRPPTASQTHETEGFDHVTADNEEAGVGQLVQSLDKMGANDVPETRREQGIEGIRTEPRAGDMKLDQGTEDSRYTGSHDQFAPQETPSHFPSVHEDTKSTPKSMNPSNPEDLPQETPTGKPGSYAEKISSATSAIADKAVAAKNVVASKLGYGGTAEETNKTQVPGESCKPCSSYEKVAGACSTAMAKVQGTAGRITGHDADHDGNTKTTDKGVSIKEYLAEKFKPGEDDKALSEVISGSLSKQKHKTEETGEAKPMRKVTESEEVEKQLGPIEDTKREGDGVSGETHIGEGFGQGAMDRLKGAVSTWLGKGGEAQANGSGLSGGAVVGGRVK
ncbi:unnamed protein product [Withania somnifera]